MDRRQNNRMLRQCPSSISRRQQHHAIAVPTAMQNRVTKTCYAEQSHKDNVRSSAVGKQLKQKKFYSVSIARHHLPTLDLFWASFFLRVQLTSLLLISPGLCGSSALSFSGEASTEKLVTVPVGSNPGYRYGSRIGLAKYLKTS